MGYCLVLEEHGKVFYEHPQHVNPVILDLGAGPIAYYILYPALEMQGLNVDKFRSLLSRK